jgi:anaerobic magnesium-protoporphyrin IX monomethyl ester cyclase
LQDTPIIERDLWKWDYRHQVLGVKHLSPTQLFLGVKLVELLYHLHPRRLWRLLTVRDPKLRQQWPFAFRHISAVFWYEVYEHFADRGRIKAVKK